MKLNRLERNIIRTLDDLGQAVAVNDLAQRMNFRGNKNYKRLIQAVAFLEEAGEIQFTDKGQIKRPQSLDEVEGYFRGNDRGFGFITYDEDQPDLFVPKHETGNAMDGDKVKVKVIKQIDPATGKGSEARVIEILERAVTQLVGEFHAYPTDIQKKRGAYGYVVPDGKQKNHYVVALEDGIKAVDGSIVVIRIKDYPSADHPEGLTGHIVKEIGHKNAPGVDIVSVLYRFGIPHVFPDQVVQEAEAIPQEVQAEEMEGRRDLRQQEVITIDGADAKDIDDGIYLETLSSGNYRLFVHIADVSHYVTEGSPIDHEAFNRGTSVYLTDRVVPMLPQQLSNGICSLNPGEDRLAMTCEMEITRQGQVVDYDFYPSVIHSHHRLTYDQVNAVYGGDKQVRQDLEDLVPMLEDMAHLHRSLETVRRRRGALDFDMPEPEVEVDDQGHPIAIHVRERDLGERLIESFMLIANETVAAYFTRELLPFIYRIHEQPDSQKMQRFAEFITTFGVVLRGETDRITPKELQAALDQVKGESYEAAVSMMMLRSMQQAKYDPDPVGHYGLAATDYTHFTAPIRRYPDLIVHRLMHLYFQGRPKQEVINHWEARLPEIAKHTSEMERRAIDAERDVDAMKKAEFMLDKVGQKFQGVISSITGFGFFVQLPNTVEGLIRLASLSDDYYYYNPDHLLLIGERTGKILRIGQAVEVELTHVDVDNREIDFKLLEVQEDDALSEETTRQIARRAKKQAKRQGKGQKSRSKGRDGRGQKAGSKSQGGRQNKRGRGGRGRRGRGKGRRGRRK